MSQASLREGLHPSGPSPAWSHTPGLVSPAGARWQRRTDKLRGSEVKWFKSTNTPKGKSGARAWNRARTNQRQRNTGVQHDTKRLGHVGPDVSSMVSSRLSGHAMAGAVSRRPGPLAIA